MKAFRVAVAMWVLALAAAAAMGQSSEEDHRLTPKSLRTQHDALPWAALRTRAVIDPSSLSVGFVAAEAGPRREVRFAEAGDMIVAVPVPDACGTTTVACLLNNRFRASVRYRRGFDNAAPDSDALVKPVTAFANANYETVFFYFNDQNNIEVLLKMLDQGNKDGSGNPTIALLYGTSTPLRIALTVTDTVKGTSKTYESLFGKMMGQTRFADFLK